MEIRRTPYRPLRIGLFIYDVVRMLVMLDVLVARIPLGEEAGLRWFPYLVYAAPNAIFPLMGLFLLIRPEAYRPFTHLYIAGKSVSLVSALGWIAFPFRAALASNLPSEAASFRGLLTALLLYREWLFALGGILLLIVLDALSLLGEASLRKRLYPEVPLEPPVPGEAVTPSGGSLL
jgi:hypothetical protein